MNRREKKYAGETFEGKILHILPLQLNHWCQTCLVSRQVTKPHPKRRDGPWERPSISKSSYDTILFSVYTLGISQVNDTARFGLNFQFLSKNGQFDHLNFSPEKYWNLLLNEFMTVEFQLATLPNDCEFAVHTCTFEIISLKSKEKKRAQILAGRVVIRIKSSQTLSYLFTK